MSNMPKEIQEKRNELAQAATGRITIAVIAKKLTGAQVKFEARKMFDAAVEIMEARYKPLVDALEEIGNNGLEFETAEGTYVVDSNPIEVAQKALTEFKGKG